MDGKLDEISTVRPRIFLESLQSVDTHCMHSSTFMFIFSGDLASSLYPSCSFIFSLSLLLYLCFCLCLSRSSFFLNTETILFTVFGQIHGAHKSLTNSSPPPTASSTPHPTPQCPYTAQTAAGITETRLTYNELSVLQTAGGGGGGGGE